MRICLLNPPITVKNERAKSVGVFQPLGLAYIAAELIKDGHEVSILDALVEGAENSFDIGGGRIHIGLSNEEIHTKIFELNPDVVGITVPFSIYANNALEIASLIKKINKNIHIILGGAHPTIMPEDVISNLDIDFVVIGEGEITTKELVIRLEEKELHDFNDIKGIAYKKNGKIIITEKRPFIEKLDSIPFPARHLLPLNKYNKIIGFNRAAIITSRGCPFKCTFCSNHLLMGYKWRYRSPENVIEEIEELISKYKVNEIFFEDDNLTANKERIQKICTMIIEKKLKIKWFTRNGIRADTLDEDTLKLMKKSGCQRIWLAPESGSQKVLDNIVKKKLDLSKIEEVVKNCKKIGLQVGCFFIIGLIGETKEDIAMTINFARKLKKLGANGFWISIATPYPGTELYQKGLKEGFINSSIKFDELSVFEGIIDSPEFTNDWLKKVQEESLNELNRLNWNSVRYGIMNPSKATRYVREKICK